VHHKSKSSSDGFVVSNLECLVADEIGKELESPTAEVGLAAGRGVPIGVHQATRNEAVTSRFNPLLIQRQPGHEPGGLEHVDGSNSNGTGGTK
jgi:hypothetical protein